MKQRETNGAKGRLRPAGQHQARPAQLSLPNNGVVGEKITNKMVAKEPSMVCVEPFHAPSLRRDPPALTGPILQGQKLRQTL